MPPWRQSHTSCVLPCASDVTLSRRPECIRDVRSTFRSTRWRDVTRARGLAAMTADVTETSGSTRWRDVSRTQAASSRPQVTSRHLVDPNVSVAAEQLRCAANRPRLRTHERRGWTLAKPGRRPSPQTDTLDGLLRTLSNQPVQFAVALAVSAQCRFVAFSGRLATRFVRRSVGKLLPHEHAEKNFLPNVS